MNQDARILKRRHLIYYLEVRDAASDEVLGNLVDITTRGCKLVSKVPIPTDQTHSLRLALPHDFYEKKDLVFEARSVWSANDINPDFFDTGFEVPRLGVTERKAIRRLIERLGFND
ncbi:MAG: PilZ domain-containing protein [Thermodesulfobacteriota bacterium]